MAIPGSNQVTVNKAPTSTGLEVILKWLPLIVLLATIVAGWATFSVKLTELEGDLQEAQAEIRLNRDSYAKIQVTLAEIQKDIVYMQADLVILRQELTDVERPRTNSSLFPSSMQ